jgi:hypothetical protein
MFTQRSDQGFTTSRKTNKIKTVRIISNKQKSTNDEQGGNRFGASIASFGFTIESQNKVIENNCLSTARESKTKVEQINNKANVKEILDKHLGKFKGEIVVVKSYMKDGKKVKLIKIKRKKN